jgi:beta-phosphoglucomutase
MRAVIFDFDGVLVNSEPLHLQALRAALRPEGIDVDEEEYAAFYLAYDDREGARIALERHGVAFDADRVEGIALRKEAAFEALLPSVRFFPGARELVRSLAAELPLAIASGALRREIEAILGAAGLRDSFSAIVGAEDVSRGKPHPEPYLTACALLGRKSPGLAPGECLVFEDSMPGIVSARAAGMQVVGVTHTYPAAKLQHAHRVVPGFTDLDTRSLHGLFGEGQP